MLTDSSIHPAIMHDNSDSSYCNKTKDAATNMKLYGDFCN